MMIVYTMWIREPDMTELKAELIFYISLFILYSLWIREADSTKLEAKLISYTSLYWYSMMLCGLERLISQLQAEFLYTLYPESTNNSTSWQASDKAYFMFQRSNSNIRSRLQIVTEKYI